jgi:hypothetical protein
MADLTKYWQRASVQLTHDLDEQRTATWELLNDFCEQVEAIDDEKDGFDTVVTAVDHFLSSDKAMMHLIGRMARIGYLHMMAEEVSR